MLRLHFLQHWYNLSDPAAEEAVYDSLSLRRFVGIDLGREPVPDETTILNFRHLLEQHNLGKPLFERVNEHLASRGLKVAGGTIVDATIIAAPSSTKNATKARDPEMHQTRKGQQWYFGMKLHIGVDSKTKLIHAMTTTGANVHDAKVVGELLHGKETRVYGDQAYRGQTAVIREHAPNAKDFTNQRYRQGAVPWIGQEHAATVADLRSRKSVHRPASAAAHLIGVLCPVRVSSASNGIIPPPDSCPQIHPCQCKSTNAWRTPSALSLAPK
jgi:IS5 family transposase